MQDYLVQQIEHAILSIREVEKNPEIRSVRITKPKNISDAYLLVSWVPSGATEAESRQPYGAPIGAAGNVTEYEVAIRAAAVYFGCKPEHVVSDAHKGLPEGTDLTTIEGGPAEAFSNTGASQVGEEYEPRLFEIHDTDFMIEAAAKLGWRRWAFKPRKY